MRFRCSFHAISIASWPLFVQLFSEVPYVSAQLVGHHVVLHLDAHRQCVQVLFEQALIKELPLRGLVGHPLSFELFLTHMLHQARAQARLRSLQERRYRTAAMASP